MNPPERTPWATISLIAINVVVFAAVNKGLSIPDQAAIDWGVSVAKFSPVTLVTSMFLHADPLHLIGNMWFLYLFGFAVEGRLGWLKFVLFYLLSSFVGDLLHLLVVGTMAPELPTIGASGAVMGVLGMGMYMFAHARIDVFIFWFPWIMGVRQWPLWGVGAYYLFFDLLSASISVGVGLPSGVASLAHLGGAAAGFLAMMIIRMPRDDQYTSDAKAMLAETKDYGILSATQLHDLAVHQPDNAVLSLEWISRILRSGYRMDPEAVQRFKKHAPQLLTDDNVDVNQIAFVLSSLPDDLGIPPHLYSDCGVKCEKAGIPVMAKQLYYRVLTNPAASPQEKESAAFKAGMVMEAWFQDYVGARDMYDWALVQWPFGAFEGQFKARLMVVRPRADAQAATQATAGLQ